MLFINYDIHASKDNVLESLYDNDLIVEQEKYDTKSGVPKMSVKQNGDKIKITCEYTGDLAILGKRLCTTRNADSIDA